MFSTWVVLGVWRREKEKGKVIKICFSGMGTCLCICWLLKPQSTKGGFSRSIFVLCVLGRFQHLLSKQLPHKPTVNGQRGRGLSALLSKKHCQGTSCIKGNGQINLRRETRPFCLSQVFLWEPSSPKRGTGKWRGKGSRAKWGWESVYFRLALEKRRILMYMPISAAPVFYHTLVWFISINCSDVCNTELGRHGHQFPQATDSQM